MSSGVLRDRYNPAQILAVIRAPGAADERYWQGRLAGDQLGGCGQHRTGTVGGVHRWSTWATARSLYVPPGAQCGSGPGAGHRRPHRLHGESSPGLFSAYLEGNLPGRSLFCVYPSSRPGKVSAQIEGFLEKAKVMVGSYYKEDLLERVHQAPDTSLERLKASSGQATTADISIGAQARPLRVSCDYRRKLRGKR